MADPDLAHEDVGARERRVLRDHITVPVDVGSQVNLGDSKNTVRGYCLDIPRFEESLRIAEQLTPTQTFEEQAI